MMMMMTMKSQRMTMILAGLLKNDDPDWTPEKLNEVYQELDEVYQELGDDNVNDSQTTKPRYCIGRTITY